MITKHLFSDELDILPYCTAKELDDWTSRVLERTPYTLFLTFEFTKQYVSIGAFAPAAHSRALLCRRCFVACAQSFEVAAYVKTLRARHGHRVQLLLHIEPAHFDPLHLQSKLNI